jgi:putative nucleotidyltransferase with HDIG domain
VYALAEKLRSIEVSAEDDAHERLEELAGRLEVKDGYAREHTAAVSGLAVAIAARLGRGAEQRSHVEVGALLHDVGKLSVPDRILTKRGRLTKLEWTIMRRHAVSGERLLVDLLDVPDILAVVRSHHERWDGRGYPDGKQGEEIPIAARIVAVADAFQAMIEPRPYRPPRSPKAALNELKRASGTQFDPACVDALQHSLAA